LNKGADNFAFGHRRALESRSPHQVVLGRLGIVLGVVVSRLARNNADRYRLVEFCGVTDTLIGNSDVYAVRNNQAPNRENGCESYPPSAGLTQTPMQSTIVTLYFLGLRETQDGSRLGSGYYHISTASTWEKPSNI